MKEKDQLGNRMKSYESIETERFLYPGLPILVRIDGKAFHTYTRKMEKPFDMMLVNAFIETTKKLVEKLNAIVGYTQSDEITLILPDDREILYERKIHKLTSVIASMATMYFNSFITDPDKKNAIFDCRVWQVPNRSEAINCLIWRELDATKNAISIAASCYYSHKQLLNKNSKEKQEMLFQKGINFNGYPVFFKRGTYIHRKLIMKRFTKEEIEKLPPNHEARKKPEITYVRHSYEPLDIPPLYKILNRINVIYYDEPYRTESNQDKPFLKNFTEAWYWLSEHPCFNGQLGSRLWISAVRVNPNTGCIDNDHNLNTEPKIWLEPQTYNDEEDEWCGGLDLECDGKDFNEAIITLANLVYNHYGDYTEEDVKRINLERIARLNQKLSKGETKEK